MKDPVCAYVALGSNLGDRLAHLRGAVAALGRLPATRMEACSPLYGSAPIGLTAQPDFLNAVCRLRTRLPPQVLLGQLLAIEAAFGRLRHAAIPGGPRTLDLDLLLYDDVLLRTAELELPHPRLHERAFVLRPLCDLDRDVEIPLRGRGADWLPACAHQETRRLVDARWVTPGRSHADT